MGEPSGRKKSKMKIPGIGVPAACMGGLLHFLDVNQRLHIRKALTYNKRSTEKAKSPTPKHDLLAQSRQQPAEKDAAQANAHEEEKSKNPGNNPGKQPMRNVRRHSEQDVGQNLSPLSSQLLRRTVSIHHMENNEYFNNAARAIEKPPFLHEAGSSVEEEHISLQPEISDSHGDQTKASNKLPDHLIEKHSLLREKLNNAREMAKRKDAEPREFGQDAAFQQSKEFMEMMALLNNNRELLLKILKNPSTFENFLECQRNLSLGQNDEMSGVRYTPERSESLTYVEKGPQPGMLSAKRNINEKRPGDESSSTGSEPSNTKPGSSEHEGGQKENEWAKHNAAARFKVITKNIQDVIKENKKKSLRVSMDAVLDKIPYGSKSFKDAKKEKKGMLERTATTRYDRESSRSKSMKRSQSLNESLDKYSHLLETIPEPKRVPERPKVKQEDSDRLQATKPPKTLARIHSLPDFDTTSLRNDVQHRAFDTVRSLKIHAAEDDLGEPRPLESLQHIVKNPEVDIFVRSVSKKDGRRGTVGNKNQQMATKEQGKCEVFDSSKSLKAQDAIQAPLQEEDPCSWLTKTNVISELDYYFPESLITPVVLPSSESMELKHVEKKDTSIYQQSDGSDEIEGIIADFERLRARTEVDDYSSFFSVPVDLHNEAWFSYVRDVLWKSGFGCNDFLRAWHSPNQPVNPLLFEESEWVSDPNTALHRPEEFLEYQLLFDMINEVLLEIYDSSSSCCPWLSRFDTRTRPIPEGYHVLEEVWAGISWYLEFEPQSDPMMDHAVARDLAKDRGWMDLQYDCEEVGLDLEDLILDDLLDEVVLEL